MFRFLLLLLILAGVAGYFTNPDEAAHRAAANEVLSAQADAAAENFDLGGLIETGAASIAQNGGYTNYYVASHYALQAGDQPYVDCWGAFTQVMCRRV
ncbi:MAG: hypothetical protein AB7P07_08740 [Hyphomonadaceae bacterium]